MEVYESIFEYAPDAVLVVDADGSIARLNVQAEKMFGYDRAELHGHKIEVLIPRRYAQRHVAHRSGYLAEQRLRPMGGELELYARRKDQTEFPVDIMLSSIETDRGLAVVAVVRDITEQRAELERQKFVALADSSHEFIALCDRDFRPFYVNPAGIRMVGLGDLARARAIRLQDYFFPEDQPFIEAEFFPKVQREGIGEVEIRFRHFESGDGIWMLYNVFGLRDARGQIAGWASVSRNIHDRKQAEFELRRAKDDLELRVHERTADLMKSLREKEILLQEIHHRVKNNLAVICSLFYLQSTYTEDEQTIRTLQESRDRVRSMALVHESLYQSESFAALDFAEYAQALSDQLFRTYRVIDNLKLRTDLRKLNMSIDIAVPCGLILNELITNALKHAFPERRDGELVVELRRQDDGLCLLQVSDDGVGTAVGIDIERAGSLGLRLIRSLTRQLNGEFALLPNHPGTVARLLFEVPHV